MLCSSSWCSFSKARCVARTHTHTHTHSPKKGPNSRFAISMPSTTELNAATTAKSYHARRHFARPSSGANAEVRFAGAATAAAAAAAPVSAVVSMVPSVFIRRWYKSIALHAPPSASDASTLQSCGRSSFVSSTVRRSNCLPCTNGPSLRVPTPNT